ncbi:3-dehydroquinate synthase [Gilvimarinus sp. SDUM040013]|uniref:3-dehydroquinate synthase n=1 Tax=Gilvimarinus gilvus TaxID=3058038 RepID=A0ABU4S1X8_9GAMM|nr:3-dehydroquinate synthase [Gilvimarinus sp. SDUM040013]MDO3385865.1 3-dehydroquinate synthase [Gilvimarinus sp. SDUM040013]MDX6851158.1 3-dehydroquinate synthase [Gilvimarinus sp. SDUM040013]
MYQIDQSFVMNYSFPVCFDRDTLAPESTVLTDIVSRAGVGPHRVLPVIDKNVLEAHPDLVERLQFYADVHNEVIELIEPPLIVRGGEISKSDPVEVDEFYQRTQTQNIDRHSFALVIGGGAVVDAIGYAAATAHRGIRLIRMPTTVLAQNDAGIGVKNAINYRGRKNYLGTFAAPFAVINDFDFLNTLPPRDRVSGIAEAIKVALIRDGEFFTWLHKNRSALADFSQQETEYMITRCAELHLNHIRSSGDPFEQGSARPLDFGHWCAHRLEEISASELRHGEAVAIGIALDSIYSFLKGMIELPTLNRIRETLEGVGFNLTHRALESLDIHKALEDFREHLGGKLCITLLTQAGAAIEVNEIDHKAMETCRQHLLEGVWPH